MLDYLIFEQGVDPNDQSSKQRCTPLHLAIYNRREAAALFLARDVPGCVVDARMMRDLTPLMLAAEHNSMLTVMETLVARDADVRARSAHGATAFEYAVARKQEAAAVYLLETGGWVSAWDEWLIRDGLINARFPVLHVAALAGMPRLFQACVRQLQIDRRVDLAAIADDLTHAVYRVAIERQDMAMLQAFVDARIDITRQHPVTLPDRTGRAGLLHHVCNRGYRDLVAFLMQSGCDPSEPASTGDLPLHIAATGPHTPVIDWLLSNCCALDVDATTGDGGPAALHFAAATGRLDAVKLLVEAGANPLRIGARWTRDCSVRPALPSIMGTGPWLLTSDSRSRDRGRK
jgi:ankyrin repeat protein